MRLKGSSLSVTTKRAKPHLFSWCPSLGMLDQTQIAFVSQWVCQLVGRHDEAVCLVHSSSLGMGCGRPQGPKSGQFNTVQRGAVRGPAESAAAARAFSGIGVSPKLSHSYLHGFYTVSPWLVRLVL